MTGDDTFCVLPWIHLHLWPNANAYPCCMSDSDMPVGNANDSSIMDIWHGQPLRELRRRMLDGKASAECTRCYELEASGIRTLRQHSNEAYAHLSHLASSDMDAALAPDLNMAYMDIRWSNICNLRCRTCGHDLSSGWYDDTKRLDQAYGKSRMLQLDPHGDVWQQIEPYLGTVEEVYFAGGESLVTEEHYRLLDHWIAKGHTNVRLRYTTNFTVLRYKDRDLFDLWRRFPDIRVAASLDGSNARGEYLRKNQRWSDVVANRRLMIEALPHVYFEITPTISLMNIMHMPEFHREWVEQGLVHVDHMRINMLSEPRHYSCKALPSVLKQQAADGILRHVDWLVTRGASSRTIGSWSDIVTFMHATDDSCHLPDFWKAIDRVDAIRDERFLDVFPELEVLDAWR